MRKGLASIPSREADLEVVGEATSAAEALGCVDQVRPDVVLMDVVMPDMNGMEATRQILARRPGSGCWRCPPMRILATCAAC
jgi:two-component system response regulator NreC